MERILFMVIEGVRAKQMLNPWEEILLDDYESHMQLDSVMQLQAMNKMMKGQLGAYPASSVMILGIAGGNGLEHIRRDKYRRVYGIDINSSYLKETVRRYPDLTGILKCLCIDLTRDADKLPEAELVIANLLIEYIGYDCFQEVILHVNPNYVSVIIQINMDDSWVSDSPYLHTFDGLEKVHARIEEEPLEILMKKIGYNKIKTSEYLLPNRKKLVQMDFGRAKETEQSVQP